MMKKLCVFSVFLIITISLSSCKSNQLYNVTLYNGEEVVQVIENIEKDTLIDLPVLDEDGKVFIGWTNEDYVYYKEFTVLDHTKLYAQFEVSKDVFNYEERLDDTIPSVDILGYNGDALYLKIPQMIDGKVVVNLAANAFEESKLIEVQIPRDVYVQTYAFLDSIDLKKVTFYGDYLVPLEVTINHTEYNDIIAQHTNECVITEGSEALGSWTFGEGCPIMEVKSKITHIISDIEYSIYETTINQNLYSHTIPSSFGEYAFKGATSLETVEINKNNLFILSGVFEGCSSLKTIIVDEESENFSVSEGVLYNKDLTTLIYYPNGLEATSFTIPDHVDNILYGAFLENDTLETIIIPENYNGTFELLGLHQLKEIIVDENNDSYYSMDGILFSDEVLVKYPAAKQESNYALPVDVTMIGQYAFSNNKYLETIDLGDELHQIHDYAFLESIMISTLDIPSSCSYLGSYIISDSNIQTLFIHRSVIDDGDITQMVHSFGRVDMDYLRIYVPDDSISEYSNDLFWIYYVNQIYPISEYIE